MTGVVDWLDPPLEGVRMRRGIGVARLLFELLLLLPRCLGRLVSSLPVSTLARGLDLNADWAGEGGPLATVFDLNLSFDNGDSP